MCGLSFPGASQLVHSSMTCQVISVSIPYTSPLSPSYETDTLFTWSYMLIADCVSTCIQTALLCNINRIWYICDNSKQRDEPKRKRRKKKERKKDEKKKENNEATKKRKRSDSEKCKTSSMAMFAEDA